MITKTEKLIAGDQHFGDGEGSTAESVKGTLQITELARCFLTVAGGNWANHLAVVFLRRQGFRDKNAGNGTKRLGKYLEVTRKERKVMADRPAKLIDGSLSLTIWS